MKEILVLIQQDNKTSLISPEDNWLELRLIFWLSPKAPRRLVFTWGIYTSRRNDPMTLWPLVGIKKAGVSGSWGGFFYIPKAGGRSGLLQRTASPLTCPHKENSFFLPARALGSFLWTTDLFLIASPPGEDWGKPQECTYYFLWDSSQEIHLRTKTPCVHIQDKINKNPTNTKFK